MPARDGSDERARREGRVLAEAAEQLRRFRETHPGLSGWFVDLDYDELVADPLAAVRRIYECWGAPLAAPAVEAMRWLKRRRSRYPERARPTLLPA